MTDQINLASGYSFLKAPAIAAETVTDFLKNNQPALPTTEGLESLRNEVSDYYYQQYRSEVSPDKILITPGAKNAVFNVFAALLKPGDEVLVLSPCWFAFEEMLLALNLKITFLTVTATDNYTLTPEKLAAAVTDKTKLFIYTNPGNPTGRIYTKSEIEPWLDVLNKYPEITIVSDEIYDLITFTKPVASLTQFPDPNNKHIIISGFTKNFAMPGWRVGYIVAAGEHYKKMHRYQWNSLGGVGEPEQLAAQAVLNSYKNIMSPIIEELKDNRSLVISLLQQIPGLKFTVPDGTYYFFPDFSDFIGKTTPDGEKIVTEESLFSYISAKTGVELKPGSFFGSPGFARMSFALPPETLSEALERLKEALRQLK